MAFTPSAISRQPKYVVTPAANVANCNEDSLSTPSLQPTRVNSRSKYFMRDGYLDCRENRNVEFKAGQGSYIYDILPQTVARYGCAFANGNGGNLYLGVRDDGLITGVYLTPRDESHVIRVVQRIFGMFLPRPPAHEVRFVPLCSRINYRLIPNYKVIEISVKGGTTSDMYETGDHKVYIKREGSIEVQNALQIKDLAITKYKQMLQQRS